MTVGMAVLAGVLLLIIVVGGIVAVNAFSKLKGTTPATELVGNATPNQDRSTNDSLWSKDIGNSQKAIPKQEGNSTDTSLGTKDRGNPPDPNESINTTPIETADSPADEPHPGKTPTTGTTASKDSPAFVDMSRFKLSTPYGWSSKYEADRKRWVYDSHDLNNVLTLTVIQELPAGMPTTLAAFAERSLQKDFLEKGRQFTEVTEKADLPDGFYITGKTVDSQSPGKPQPGFAILRLIDGARVCYYSTKVTDASHIKGAIDHLKSGTISTSALFAIKYTTGWLMTPDNVTLIVSQPESGELVYIDTVAEKVVKRLSVDFKPNALALQGDTLYASAKGSSQVYALDVKTGKVRKEFDTGGDSIANMACHPTQGLIYATTESFKVVAIDPKGGVSKTAGHGFHIVVDPAGKFVITGIQPPLDWDEFRIVALADGSIRIITDTWGTRAMLMKYEPNGKDLKLVATQNNAASNGWSMHLTPDGKRVTLVGGGGWHPPVNSGGTGGGHVAALFNTSDLKSMVGQAPHGMNVSFHSVLNLGATNHYGLSVTLYNGKSFVKRKVLEVSKAEERRPSVFTFGGCGRKLILWNGEDIKNDQGLHILRLELTDEEKATLRDFYK